MVKISRLTVCIDIVIALIRSLYLEVQETADDAAVYFGVVAKSLSGKKLISQDSELMKSLIERIKTGFTDGMSRFWKCNTNIALGGVIEEMLSAPLFYELLAKTIAQLELVEHLIAKIQKHKESNETFELSRTLLSLSSVLGKELSSLATKVRVSVFVFFLSFC
jgi:hypothetical protein